MEEISKVVFKIEGISNIKYEKPEEFQTSVSYQYYKQALKMTEEILKNNPPPENDGNLQNKTENSSDGGEGEKFQ